MKYGLPKLSSTIIFFIACQFANLKMQRNYHVYDITMDTGFCPPMAQLYLTEILWNWWISSNIKQRKQWHGNDNPYLLDSRCPPNKVIVQAYQIFASRKYVIL